MTAAATHARIVAERARDIVTTGLPIGPRLYPCVCGEGRHAHAGDNGTGGCKPTGCKRYRPDQAWELAYRAIDANARSLGQSLRDADYVVGKKRRAANPVLPGQWRIGVSDLDTCPKAIEYRNKPPENFTPAWEDKREAMMGTAIHDWAEERLKLIYPWRLFEFDVTVPGLDRDSRLDWYDPITCVLGDIKTAGDWRWDTLGDNGPDEATWDKVMVYALAMEAAGHPVKTVRLDYIKRCNGHDEPFERPYDAAKAEAARDRLLTIATHLDLGIELVRTGTGPTNDPLCRRCFARNHCWNIPAAEQRGRSPESFTILGDEPEYEDVIWAIREKVEAAAVRLAAEKAEKEAKTLLDGIEPGRYGDFEGYEQGGGGGADHAADARNLRGLLELPDGERPSPDAVPVPEKHRYTYVKWAKVRKATLAKEKKDRAALDKGEVA